MTLQADSEQVDASGGGGNGSATSPPQRWDVSEDERAAAHAAEQPWSAKALLTTLVKAPRLVPSVVPLAARAALHGVWNDVELGVLLDSERVRQALPGTVRGAAWSPDGRFVEAVLARVAASDDVLEIGAGVGRVARQVAPAVRSLTCSDVSGVMVREAAEHLADRPNVRCVHTSGYWLDGLADASFDVVYAHAVLIFFDLYPALATLDAARRVLRDGGTCVLSFAELAGSEWPAEVVVAARRAGRRGSFGARAARPYVRAQLQAMLEAAGFDVVEWIDGVRAANDPHPPTIVVASATRPRPS